MSLSNPEKKLKNPATKWIEFKSEVSKGFMEYYEKSQNENESGKNIEIPIPFMFIPFEVMLTVRGYNDREESRIYSNEVHNTAKEKFTVKTFGNKKAKTQGKVIACGFWKDIKEVVENAGGKFAYSVYAINKLSSTSEFELVNVMFKGAGAQAWYDYVKNACSNNWEGNVGIIKEKVLQSKGKTEYWIPVIKAVSQKNIKPEWILEAIKCDKILQQYFIDCKEKDNAENSIEKEITQVEKTEIKKAIESVNLGVGDVNEDDLPF